MVKIYQLVRQARRLACIPKMQKAVFTCLIEHSNKNGDGTQIFPGLATIALECSCSERTAQRCLKYLEGEGWIVAIYRKGGQGKPSSYHLCLDQFGWLEARPPGQTEPEEIDPQRRLNFVRGMLRRLKPDSPARERWQQECTDLEQQLGLASNVDQAAEIPAIPETPRNLPALAGNQALVRVLSQEEFEQLEIAYFGSVTAQAREPRGSPGWKKWLPFVEPLRTQYNEALQARGIVASDGHDPPMDTELEEQIQEDQRSQWQEEQRLRALIDDRERKRDALTPGTPGWRMWNALRNQAINTLKTGFYKQGGYVT